MSRKQFIESQGAICKNWRNSWAFINENERIIIFGAWNTHTENNESLILSERWIVNPDSGRKLPGYKEARKYIRLIEEEGYTLKIHLIIKSYKEFVVPGKIENFERKLTEKSLSRRKDPDGWLEWYATDISDNQLPE